MSASDDTMPYRKPATPMGFSLRKRENRANAIFIVVLLALTLPGAIILFKKKLDRFNEAESVMPGSAQASGQMMRAPVRREIAYMDPTPGRLASMRRVVPFITGDWIGSLTKQRLDPGMNSLVTAADFAPLMSDRLNWQLTAAGATDDEHLYTLIGWNDAMAPVDTLYTVTADVAGDSMPGRIVAVESSIPPINVREELQLMGYIDPPKHVLRMLVGFPTTTPPETLRVTYTASQLEITDTLRPAN